MTWSNRTAGIGIPLETCAAVGVAEADFGSIFSNVGELLIGYRHSLGNYIAVYPTQPVSGACP